ncbi:hypothetical protein R1flu_012342 [Riccia fluitans]|uniref:Uncharacterized protein n=1 Tax=Riccia fluitans TaxID=41844 RepID=A0ABD1ZAJ2_9MARC
MTPEIMMLGTDLTGDGRNQKPEQTPPWLASRYSGASSSTRTAMKRTRNHTPSQGSYGHRFKARSGHLDGDTYDEATIHSAQNGTRRKGRCLDILYLRYACKLQGIAS